MANIFAILTALVLAVSAFLAYANMGDETVPGKGYKGWITKREKEQSALDRNKATLADLQKNLNDTETELAGVKDEIETLTGEVDAQLAKNAELEETVASKKAEAEAKAAEVAEKKKSIERIGDPGAIIAKLKRTKEQLAELDAAIGENTAKRAALEQEKQATDSTIAGLKSKIDLRVSGKSAPDLRTTVRSTYPGLGFVTLGAGDNRGVVKDSRLDVVRDGEVIGKLQVTTVEATTAAADIVPDSLEPGTSIVAGDTVVAEQANADAN